MTKICQTDFFAKEKTVRESYGFISRGSRNRTHIDGFGDHCSTFELCPCIQSALKPTVEL